MIDITRNAVWTPDCQGKQDLDFSILSAYTRYWPDMTARCTITFLDRIVVAESEFLKGESEVQVKMLARQWYNEHILSALEEVVKLIKKEEEK